MEAREYVQLTNSASKRALFPSNKNAKINRSDDEDSLGHMSPLKDNSSPDRYSSPPCSPCWVAETPTKILDSEALKENISCEQKFQRLCRNLKSISQSTPEKILTDIVNDTPTKDNECDVMSPFKCLLTQRNINDTPEKYEKDITPFKNLIKRRNIEETPDSTVSKCDAAQKICWKRKLQARSPEVKSDLEKNFDFSSTVASLIRNSFYKPPESKAKASLFSDYIPAKRQGMSHVVSKSLTIRHLNATHPGGHSRKLHKRRITVGEINAGVHHRIRKPKPKKKPSLDTGRKSTEVPLVSPEQRIQHYVVKNNLLEKGNTPVKQSNHCLDTTSEQVTDTTSNADKMHLVLNTRTDDLEHSDTESCSPEEEPIPDPHKKFFKTNRTMAIDHKAVVTVVNNVKIKVHKGKMVLVSSARKIKYFKKKQPVLQDVPFEEDNGPQHDIEQVKESVQEAIQKLTEELEVPQPFDSSHIQSITSSTSSLALEDPEDLNSNVRVDKENKIGESDRENISVNSDTANYFPVFYKRKGLHDTTNSPQKKISPPFKKMRPLGNTQYQIDAGQSRFRAVHCKECDTLYHLGDPEDEIAHYNIHNNISTFRFMGWKNERVVKIYPDGGRVIVVYPDDPKPWVSKLKDVLDAVDKEMGFVDGNISGINGNKVYLYVVKHRIVGVLAAKTINEAFKMLDLGVDGPDCCSEETYPVKCGISRVWVAREHRRKRVATSLLDCMRLTFMFDHILAKHDIAFSVPTEQGKSFATHYMRTREFMVYYK